MNNILIMVDMQNGFLRSEETKKIKEKIVNLLQRDVFDIVVATKFHNYDNSVFENLLGWNRLKTTEDREMIAELVPYVDEVFEKSIYTCVNSNFLQRISQLNGGEIPKHVFVIGVDTDCCVLKIATDLFEKNIRPVVLTSYCASNGGVDSHEAGILAMKRLIGRDQLVDKKIASRNDLHNI